MLDFARGKTVHLRPEREPWRVTLVDTGLATMTGGRLRRVQHLLPETFCLTYGDGVSDVQIDKLVAFHKNSGLLATVTAISPPGRFGALQINTSDQIICGFREKSPEDGGLINGGFFVLEPAVIDLIEGDRTVWEEEPMKRLVAARQIQAYLHLGYWQNMDTLRDKQVLEDLWNSGKSPWKIWDRPQRRKAATEYALPAMAKG